MDKANDDKLWREAYKRVHSTNSAEATALRITKNFNAAMRIASEEWETDKSALEVAYITELDYQRRMTQLHKKHFWRTFGLRRDFERRLQLGLG